MIRRPPTRIELKNEDLLEYDYYQKAEKKRLPPTAQELSKLSRQERIGYVSGTLSARAHFRRVETAAAAAVAAAVSTSVSASTSGSSNQSTATTTAATATASTAAATAGSESACLNLSSDEGSEAGNDNESLAESSLVTAEGTPDLSTNMSMEVSD